VKPEARDYLACFAADPSDYYTGINAATQSALLGERELRFD